ncbi:hypothetical protein [Streptomyces sp. SAI-149]|uniref:hypothetical protein n=1 Tax=Streptomyces sp. SAI-149 TaxID=2940542 RepID=UPI002476A9DE|nr:hypothetical protein [Streptomyces sp. SAI-149]MDH6494091.1 hypothetical protein [Streptomyces sp. SAI-149]
MSPRPHSSWTSIEQAASMLAVFALQMRSTSSMTPVWNNWTQQSFISSVSPAP